MWRKLLRPEVLFLLGTLQMLLPYLLIALEGVPDRGFIKLSYYPMAISIMGYICFWLGVKVGPRNTLDRMESTVPVSAGLLKGVLVLMLVITIIEIIGLIGVYGGIPLLEFISGAANVDDTNNAQASSGFGQVGAASLTVYLLMGLTCLIAIKAKQEGTRVTAWTSISIFLVVFLAAFNGKRQGVLMCIVILACCSIVVYGSPYDLISSFLPGSISRRGAVALGVLLFLGVLRGIGGLASIRNSEGAISTTDELILYYDWPVLNMSEQADEAGGFGPYEMKPFGPLRYLLPAKTFVDPEIFGTDQPRFEPSSPSGFYELLQWTTGLWGIIPFAFFCGLFCQYMYKMAFKGYAALLSYSLIAWALFSAPLYNHFLNLQFLPMPAMLFLAAAYVHRQFKRSLI